MIVAHETKTNKRQCLLSSVQVHVSQPARSLVSHSRLLKKTVRTQT